MKIGKKEIRLLSLVGQVGLTMVASIVIGLFVGLWVDRKLGSSPWATLFFIAAGIAAAALGIYRMIMWALTENED